MANHSYAKAVLQPDLPQGKDRAESWRHQFVANTKEAEHSAAKLKPGSDWASTKMFDEMEMRLE